MLLLLFFLFPLALYLLILGLVNRRRHALVVPGTWDFVGVLCACSGFILAGTTFLLSSLSDRWRMFWLFGDRRQLHEFGNAGRLWFLLFVALGAVALVTVTLWVLWRRKRMTVIYNTEPAVFEDALAQALDSKGFSWSRTGNRVAIVRQADNTASAREAVLVIEDASAILGMPLVAPVQAARDAGPQDEAAFLDLDVSPLLRNVTLCWTASSDEAEWAVRQEVEVEVGRVLAEVRTAPNPVAGWLLSVGVVLLGVCFLLIVFLLQVAEAMGR